MICIICKKEFKDITNTHLKFHNLTRSSYRKLDSDFNAFLKTRMSNIAKGKIDIKKGKTYEDVVGKEKASLWKTKLSNKRKGTVSYIRDENFRKNLSKKLKGRRFNIKNEFQKGVNHPCWGKKGKEAVGWKGGITPVLYRIRTSYQYKQWRQSIFIRDNYTCQKCKQYGGGLEAHHRKPFSKLVQEAKGYMPLLSLYDACMIYTPLWDRTNGLTLCNKCHKL